MIATCTECGSSYPADSVEQAYEPVRLCLGCRATMYLHQHADRDSGRDWSGKDGCGCILCKRARSGGYQNRYPVTDAPFPGV